MQFFTRCSSPLKNPFQTQVSLGKKTETSNANMKAGKIEIENEVLKLNARGIRGLSKQRQHRKKLLFLKCVFLKLQQSKSERKLTQAHKKIAPKVLHMNYNERVLARKCSSIT